MIPVRIGQRTPSHSRDKHTRSPLGQRHIVIQSQKLMRQEDKRKQELQMRPSLFLFSPVLLSKLFRL